MIDEEAAMQLQAMPNVPINFVPVKAGETFSIGMITVRIMEDGSRTGGFVASHHITQVFHLPQPAPTALKTQQHLFASYTPASYAKEHR